jgi:hypothetical protein
MGYRTASVWMALLASLSVGAWQFGSFGRKTEEESSVRGIGCPGAFLRIRGGLERSRLEPQS